MSIDDVMPLPRGRHGLTREQVEGSQRERVLRALADVMAERGYAATSVADVLRVAGVSRSTFYELFTSKDDCFMTAFELATQIVLTPATERAPAGTPKTPADRFSHGLASYLNAIADEPALARVFLVEVYATGPEGARRRAAAMDRYADVIAGLLGADGEDDRFAVRALVASISMLVTTRLADGDVDGVRALHAPVLRFAERSGIV